MRQVSRDGMLPVNEEPHQGLRYNCRVHYYIEKIGSLIFSCSFVDYAEKGGFSYAKKHRNNRWSKD